jgi:hypothetical protein
VAEQLIGAGEKVCGGSVDQNVQLAVYRTKSTTASRSVVGKTSRRPQMMTPAQPATNEDAEERDEPSRTRSDSSESSSSTSSFTDDFSPLSCWREGEEVTEEVYRPAVVPPRRVSIHQHVEVREYLLTISDHPCCEDPCPASLDWAHASPCFRYIDDSKIRGPPTIRAGIDRASRPSVDDSPRCAEFEKGYRSYDHFCSIVVTVVL